jgi:two-component system chemotaxis sensor kinase CheA
MSVDVAAFHQAFFEEAADLLNDFEQHLLVLERNPDDRELLNSIFRCAHSLKGGSATFGFPNVAHFTHGVETLLDEVRNGRIPVTRGLCELLLRSLDQMNQLMAEARGEGTAPDASQLEADLVSAAGGTLTHGSEAVVEVAIQEEVVREKTFELYFRPGPDVMRQGSDPLRILKQFCALGSVETIACDTSFLPPMAELDPERVYLAWTVRLRTLAPELELLEPFDFVIDESEVRLTAQESFPLAGSEEFDRDQPAEICEATAPLATGTTPVASGGATSVAPRDGGTIRVSAEKLDLLINLVGELVISQSMVTAVADDFTADKLPRLQESVSSMERTCRELQERVMAIRLLPIKMAFGRFPRLVHDLATACGKKVELKLVGEETELDKNLIEAIGDPLTHLVRNSVDHGLETPEDRRAAGKSETGNLTVSAYHEGGGIIVEVTDDGRGLSREKILKKARERGLPGIDDNMSDEAVNQLIFQPGFSTAAAITDVSGRGVGMDIVKQSITRIGGSIRIFTVPGQGTTMRMRMPLTMAIVEGQTMAVGEDVYIVPLTSIVESLRPQEQDLHCVTEAGEIVIVRGEIIPVLRLYRQFGIEPRITEPWNGSLVVVENDGKKVALFADELLGQGQVVIKSLEANYRKVHGITGATILGDGRVALILDVPALIRGNEEEREPHLKVA